VTSEFASSGYVICVARGGFGASAIAGLLLSFILMVKVYGHITCFTLLADFAGAMRFVPGIKKVSGRIICCLLFCTVSWPGKLPLGRYHYALANRRL